MPLVTVPFLARLPSHRRVAPHNWLLTRRIGLAKEKLRNTRLSLAEAALACGFAGRSPAWSASVRAPGVGRWMNSERRSVIEAWLISDLTWRNSKRWFAHFRILARHVTCRNAATWSRSAGKRTSRRHR